MHDRVVGHARAERIVLGLVGGRGAGALLGLVGAPALLGARLARCGGADLDRVARDAPAARALGQRDELVGGVVDRLQVTLVLELAPGRREVGVPDLGQPTARQLDVALVERRLELQEEERLLDLEHCGHEHPTIAPRSSIEEARPQHCIERAAHTTGERAAAIHGPIELRAVEDGVYGIGQNAGVAGLELARSDGRVEQGADRAPQATGVSDGERAQLRIGEVELQQGEVVGEGGGVANGRGERDQAIGQRGQRRLARCRQRGAGARRGARGRGHEQGALGAEALHERRRGDPRLAGDVGQCQPRGPDGPDRAERRVQERVVGVGARAACHL
jgi:hypothetical protein